MLGIDCEWYFQDSLIFYESLFSRKVQEAIYRLQEARLMKNTPKIGLFSKMHLTGPKIITRTLAPTKLVLVQLSDYPLPHLGLCKNGFGKNQTEMVFWIDLISLVFNPNLQLVCNLVRNRTGFKKSILNWF